MNDLAGLIIPFAIFFVISVCVVYILIKDFAANLGSNKLLTTIFIILFSVIGTYVIALFFKRFNIIEQVGSVDAWIGFAGSGMGGIITMLALYYTLKQNQEMIRANRITSLRPYVSCDITNLDDGKHEILISDCIENYDFIKCKIKNISSNIANGIRIIDEYSLVEIGKDAFQRFDDLLDSHGISIYTTSLNDGTFLAPQEGYNWKTNVCVESNQDGNYKWHGSSFVFKHIIVFEFKDLENLQTYNHFFEFDININVDIENKLHFYLWNISNSIKPVDNHKKGKCA